MAVQNIGFIGFGKMGKAIGRALIKHGKTIYAYTPHQENVDPKHYQNFEDVIKNSDVIIMAAKPQHIIKNIEDAYDYLTRDKIVISIAAGVPLNLMQKAAGGKAPIVRSMPNLPAAVGKGLFALCFDDPSISEAQRAEITELFNLIGSTQILKENMIDAFTGLAGSGPGIVFHFMEAFYEAAVTLGFSHKEARKLTSETFLGTAALATQSTYSFYDLKMQVCSPGGVTIQGINLLEKESVKSDIVQAILIAAKANNNN